MPDRTVAPVIAGLVVGIVFIVTFAVFAGSIPTKKADAVQSTKISTVIIPENASLSSSGKAFEPQTIKVVIVTNNTVIWVNHDTVENWIQADTADDPDFSVQTLNPKPLRTAESFKYTFTQPGEFGYHGRPWQRGIVTVLPPMDKTIPTLTKLSQYDAIQIVEKDFKIRQSDYDGINGIVVNATSGYVRIEEFWFKTLELPLVYTHPNGTLFRITGNGYENMGECNSGLIAYCGYLPPYNFDYKGRLLYGIEVLLSSEENLPDVDYARGFPFLYIVDANSGEIVDSTFLREAHIRD